MAVRSEGAQEARGAERRSAMAPSTLRARDLGATDVTVVDLSLSGVRIATEAELAVGEEVSIGLTGIGARRAYVAWRRDGQYGCAFERPLEAAEAGDAFSSVSVVRLGSLGAPSKDAPSPALADLHSSHRPLWLPLDAVLFGIVYLALFAWGAYRLLRLA